VGAIEPQQYEMLLTTAHDGNMNMLRVWGGGIYEHDVFYDICDRLGLLIWQDFMFACAPYPESDATFNAEVASEAQYQVRRLRSHPCLALWCGNNENQWIADQHRWNHPGEPVPGALFYNHTLPAAVAAQDGFTPYWLGSPYGGNDYNSQEDGDRHNWDVWHGLAPRRFGEPVRVDQSPAGVSYRRYADDQGRFISEFGMHAAPMASTLRRVIPEDQLYHHSPSMDHHNKDNPKNKGDNLMLTVTGLPRDLAEYVDFSMVAQAEGLKFGVEHFRRRMPHCSGTLVWQLNDCWPVLSWSVVDYYGVPKAGYHYLKRAYAPLLASFKERADGGVELWLTNGSGMDVRDTLSVSLWDFDGTALWNASVSAQAPAGTSRLLRSWSSQELGAGADRFLAVASPIGTVAPNRHFFVPIKDLQRVSPDVEVLIAATGERTLRIELSCRAFAYFVVIETPGGFAHLSDNYFDLYPGERYAVTLTDPVKAPAPEEVAVRWR
jgi:beta-mannosidase